VIIEIFLECDRAIRRGQLIHRQSRTDKEFPFQNWFQARLDELQIQYDSPTRNSYPDFTLVNQPAGYEVKALAYPGREATYDANSQMPSGLHNGRTIFCVFGRYPKAPQEDSYPVIDLVVFHGDFLNARHDYIHENKHITGFGSYGDVMIRDRKMYVAPTPFALVAGAAGQKTLILPSHFDVDDRLEACGELVRIEAEQILIGYVADLKQNTIEPRLVSNPTAGSQHRFTAYRSAGSPGPRVKMNNSGRSNHRHPNPLA
jgi:hypothetical protein